MNNINLIGRITKDIEVKTTTSGQKVCNFNVAVDRRGKNGERVADFIPVTCWNKTAEIVAQYFAKGRMIGITGSLQTQQYQDKDTGKNRTSYAVVAERIFFCGEKAAQQNVPAAQQMPQQNYAPAPQQYQQVPQQQAPQGGYQQQMPVQGGYQQAPQQNVGYAPAAQQMPAQGYAPAQQVPQQMPTTGNYMPLADDGDLPF